MINQSPIYADSGVCEWHLAQINLQATQDITAKKALYHVPFPYDRGYGVQFELRVNQSLIHSDCVVVLCSELHDKTVDFIQRYQNPKIKFFICGNINGIDTSIWMDWFITSSQFYRTNPTVLDKLNPFQVKPKGFDILLGLGRDHRTLIYNYVNDNNLNNQVLMTYINQNKIPSNKDSATWIWETEGVELISPDIKWTVGEIKYYDHLMSLSQVIPIQIYNQTAFSLVTETNFADNFVFHTEKIVKPILARRLFIVYGGQHYLKNLHKLGFKTFSDIINESYDNEPDYRKRGQLICEQISYLLQQDQQQILDAIKPIVEHNYRVMIEMDWYGDFAIELRSAFIL